MSRRRLTHWLVLLLGILYVAAGIAETVRLTRSGDGGLLFWFGTLVGGGALVLVGEAVHRARAGLGATLVCVGAVAGVMATVWTLVVPVFAIAVMVLALKRYDEQSSPATGQPPEAEAA